MSGQQNCYCTPWVDLAFLASNAAVGVEITSGSVAGQWPSLASGPLGQAGEIGQYLCLQYIFLADGGRGGGTQPKTMQKLFRDEDGFEQGQHWSSYLEAGQRENLGSRLIVKVCIISCTICGEPCLRMLLAFHSRCNGTSG